MKTGEKYIVEIGEIIRGYGNKEDDPARVSEPLAKIKGFNSLVFDENGLKKLKKLEETEQGETIEKCIKELHELKDSLEKNIETYKKRLSDAEQEITSNAKAMTTNANAGEYLIRCRDCARWEREDAYSHVGYCSEHRFVKDYRDIEVGIHPKTEEDFFCADGFKNFGENEDE